MGKLADDHWSVSRQKSKILGSSETGHATCQNVALDALIPNMYRTRRIGAQPSEFWRPEVAFPRWLRLRSIRACSIGANVRNGINQVPEKCVFRFAASSPTLAYGWRSGTSDDIMRGKFQPIRGKSKFLRVRVIGLS